MVILFIFLILVFVLIELYNYKKNNKVSHFTNKAYDYYFNGDMLVGNNGEQPTNIGIGTKPDSRYYLNVNGTMTINGKLNMGGAVFDYDLVNKINRLPLYSKDQYCLYESVDKSKKQCVNRNQLGMITGHSKVVFENRYGEKLTDLKLRHHGRHHGSEPGNNRGNNKWHEGIGYKDVRFIHRQEPYWNREWHHTLQNKASDKLDDTNQFQLIAQDLNKPPSPPGVVVSINGQSPSGGLQLKAQFNFLLFNPNNNHHIRFSGTKNKTGDCNAEQNEPFIRYMNNADIPNKNAVDGLDILYNIPESPDNDKTYNAVLERRGTKYCIRIYDKELSDTEGKPVWLFFNSIYTGRVGSKNETGRYTRYPYGTSYFTLENFDENKENQTRVRIKDSAGRYMKIKRRMTDGEIAGWSILLAVVIIGVAACAFASGGACLAAIGSAGSSAGAAASAAFAAVGAKLSALTGISLAASKTSALAAFSAKVSTAYATGKIAAIKAIAYGVAGGGAKASLATIIGVKGAIGVSGSAIASQAGLIAAGLGSFVGTKAFVGSVIVTGAAQGGFIAQFTQHDMAFESHYVSKDCDLTLLSTLDGFGDVNDESKFEVSNTERQKKFQCRFD
jgi:hypothetical protein